MSTDDTTSQSSSGLTFTLILIGALVLSLAFVSWMNFSNQGGTSLAGGLDVGSPAPELKADVWVRGEAPDPAELEGEVYVVVAWATWCGPCSREAPHLVEVQEQFQHEGVQFFGLTAEPPEAEETIVAWLDKRDITWPNGFGPEAARTLMEFQADYIPGMWVIGRDGNVWWNRGMSDRESLEEALRRTVDGAAEKT